MFLSNKEVFTLSAGRQSTRKWTKHRKRMDKANKFQANCRASLGHEAKYTAAVASVWSAVWDPKERFCLFKRAVLAFFGERLLVQSGWGEWLPRLYREKYIWVIWIFCNCLVHAFSVFLLSPGQYLRMKRTLKKIMTLTNIWIFHQRPGRGTIVSLYHVP